MFLKMKHITATLDSKGEKYYKSHTHSGLNPEPPPNERNKTKLQNHWDHDTKSTKKSSTHMMLPSTVFTELHQLYNQPFDDKQKLMYN